MIKAGRKYIKESEISSAHYEFPTISFALDCIVLFCFLCLLHGAMTDRNLVAPILILMQSPILFFIVLFIFAMMGLASFFDFTKILLGRRNVVLIAKDGKLHRIKYGDFGSVGEMRSFMAAIRA